MKLDSISEAYIGMIAEDLHPAEIAQLKADTKRTGKTHAQLADENKKYADHMENIGRTSLAARARAISAQHSELASIKEETEEVDEEIKGMKHAGSILTKMRAANAEAKRTVALVRLKKDGGESGMHDARKSFNTEEDARKHHEQIVGYNPKSLIRHNLYIDGKLKEVLG